MKAASRAIKNSYLILVVPDSPPLLQLPLGTEHEAVRTQAVEVLQYLLQAPGNGPSVDGVYLRQAISGLTGPEVVNLLDWQQVADSREIADW